MKNFYLVVEPWEKDTEKYYKLKRETVLNTIKPICDAFGIVDYDYVIELDREGLPLKEQLYVEGQSINCFGNSIGAVVKELINFVWISSGICDRLCHFREQTLNQLKTSWLRN